jgi:hypothetical protein
MGPKACLHLALLRLASGEGSQRKTFLCRAELRLVGAAQELQSRGCTPAALMRGGITVRQRGLIVRGVRDGNDDRGGGGCCCALMVALHGAGVFLGVRVVLGQQWRMNSFKRPKLVTWPE